MMRPVVTGSGQRSPSVTTSRCLVRAALLALITGWYLAATLPDLADYPVLDWPQMGIAAPAYKLASQGIYGNDLFTGFHRTELRNYEYMPAYPLLVAASFKLLGLGVWQARAVSVLCGLLTVLLMFYLGRRLYDDAVGLVAAGILCALQLDPRAGSAGMPLLDFARVIRYDILVPVFVLASCIVFVGAVGSSGRRMSWGLWFAGVLTGLATLSHVYGAFILPVLFVVLWWHLGGNAPRMPSLYLLPLGWIVGILPWLLYVSQDPAAYLGQMARHEGRFDILELDFYWSNLVREIGRYSGWLKPFPEGLLTLRVGIWVLVAGVGGGFALLWRRSRSEGLVTDRFLLLAAPMLALQLALLMNLKRYPYVVLVLPFLALLTALSLVTAWRWARGRRFRVAQLGLAALGAAAVIEAGWGIAQMLRVARTTTPYLEVTAAISASIPKGSRLLISQPYWLGLAQYETRSLNLLYVDKSRSLQQSMEHINPDYVVVERSFLSNQYTGPLAAMRWWQEVRRYLEARCGRVATVEDASYGRIDIHRCRNPALTR